MDKSNNSCDRNYCSNIFCPYTKCDDHYFSAPKKIDPRRFIDMSVSCQAYINYTTEGIKDED